MWSATIEADTGEVLAMLDFQGFIGGKGLLNFQTIFDWYCRGGADEEVKVWFQQIDDYLEGKLCEIASHFLNSIYSGYWNYQEDEYEFFIHRTQDESITEEIFKKALAKAESCWTDLKTIIECVQQLLTAFYEVKPEYNYWYYPDVIVDFEALKQTLAIFSQRRARTIRINIH